MGIEKFVKMAAGGLMGYLASPILIPYGASYAYATATRIITTITGMYIGSGHTFSGHSKPAY